MKTKTAQSSAASLSVQGRRIHRQRGEASAGTRPIGGTDPLRALLAKERWNGKRRPKTVTCGDCGDSFELSARNEYGWRKRGLQPVCVDCRRPPKPVTEVDRSYWTARFTMDEITAMGCGIWPEV